jgi:hypothetical protein
MSPPRRASALERYFAGLTEQTFESRLGVADPPLVDYLCDLLVRFVRTDIVYRLRNPRGERLAAVAQMRMEADQRIGSARRAAHRQIGDFTLFWAGLYPEALSHLQDDSRIDHLLNYRAEGKRAYHIASTIPGDSEDPGAEILRRLSAEFDLLAYGLGEVRREWDRRDDDPLPIIVVD